MSADDRAADALEAVAGELRSANLIALVAVVAYAESAGVNVSFDAGAGSLLDRLGIRWNGTEFVFKGDSEKGKS